MLTDCQLLSYINLYWAECFTSKHTQMKSMGEKKKVYFAKSIFKED